MTMDVQPNTYYVKDGSRRHVVKVLFVSATHVTFTWMGIQQSIAIEEFEKHYTYITVPSMGDAK